MPCVLLCPVLVIVTCYLGQALSARDKARGKKTQPSPPPQQTAPPLVRPLVDAQNQEAIPNLPTCCELF